MKNRLKEIRASKGITQEELAIAAGISRTTLSQIETESSVPDAETVAKLVKALNVPANRIFYAFDVVS